MSISRKDTASTFVDENANNAHNWQSASKVVRNHFRKGEDTLRAMTKEQLESLTANDKGYKYASDTVTNSGGLFVLRVLPDVKQKDFTYELSLTLNGETVKETYSKGFDSVTLADHRTTAAKRGGELIATLADGRIAQPVERPKSALTRNGGKRKSGLEVD
jgi:hypothetical protein